MSETIRKASAFPAARYGLRSSFPQWRASVLKGADGAIAGRGNRQLPRRPSSQESAGALPLLSALPHLKADDTRRFARACQATALVLRKKYLIPTATGFWVGTSPEDMKHDGFELMPRISSATGTSFLVTPGHVAMAAHSISADWVEQAAFVFDFHPDCLRQPEGDLPLRYEFARDAVSFGDAIVNLSASPRSDDIVIVRLKQATHRKALTIANPAALAEGVPVALVGCARMQPITVVTASADAPAPRVFVFNEHIVQTNIDAFQGSSGSALLDADGEVLGVHMKILVDDLGVGQLPTLVDEDIVVASAVRMHTIAETLQQIGAVIRN